MRFLEVNSPENVAAFMQDYEKGTTRNPLEKKARIYSDNVSLTVVPWDNRIHLSDIHTFGDKGAGYGSNALKFLTNLADKHDVEIGGFAIPYSEHGKGKKDLLHNWYKKHGFEISGDSKLLYTPNTPLRLGTRSKPIQLRGFNREH